MMIMMKSKNASHPDLLFSSVLKCLSKGQLENYNLNELKFKDLAIHVSAFAKITTLYMINIDYSLRRL